MVFRHFADEMAPEIAFRFRGISRDISLVRARSANKERAYDGALSRRCAAEMPLAWNDYGFIHTPTTSRYLALYGDFRAFISMPQPPLLCYHEDAHYFAFT